jgi:hypothetical protein
MSSVGGVNGSSSVYGVGSLDGGMGGMSPDALLEYCQMQMNNLDGQVGDLEKQMQQQINDQKTVKNLQAQLEQFGTDGPSSADDMKNAYNDYQQAISSMPDGDPTKAALQQALTNMCNTYGFRPGRPLTPAEQKDYQLAQNKLGLDEQRADKVSEDDRAAQQKTIDYFNAVQQGQLSTKPSDDKGSWQSVTDAVNAIAGQINSDTQMQMLDLQQLASQQQNATELTIQLLQKTDSTLLDVAKNA